MAKRKTSSKREFSLENIKPIKLKKDVFLETHSPNAALKDSQLVILALMEALKDGDSLAFKEILSAHLEVINKEEFSKRADIPKRTLFRILSPEGNPTLDNVAKLVRALYAA